MSTWHTQHYPLSLMSPSSGDGASPGRISELEPANQMRGRQMPLYTVDVCRAPQTASGIYYAFQIRETMVQTVRVKYPEYGSNSTIECSHCCQSQPCRHATWLMNQITQVTLAGNETNSPAPAWAGLALSHPYWQIAHLGIDQLARRAGWEVLGGHANRPQRTSEVEARGNTAPGPRRRGLEAMDIEALLVKEASEVIAPPLVRTTEEDFFRSKRIEADKHISEMYRYLQAGPRAGQLYDTPWCAKALADTVASVSKAVLQQPLSRSARQEAAGTLVHILEAVVLYNHDAYDHPKWRRNFMRTLSECERNLFHRLVVTVYPPFVLYELSFLLDVTGHLLRRLEAIYGRMMMRGAPTSYMAMFRSLVNIIRRWEDVGGRETRIAQGEEKVAEDLS